VDTDANTNSSSKTWKRGLRLIVLGLALLSLAGSAHGVQIANQGVTFAWTASTDTNVQGYFLYYGTASGQCTNRVVAGNNLSISVANLNEGTTYFFQVTAYDGEGNESVPTAEIQVLTPGGLKMAPGLNRAGQRTLTFAVAAGHSYEVQATEDLVNWTTVYQTTASAAGWLNYADPQSSVLQKRFYRLVMH